MISERERRIVREVIEQLEKTILEVDALYNKVSEILKEEDNLSDSVLLNLSTLRMHLKTYDDNLEDRKRELMSIISEEASEESEESG